MTSSGPPAVHAIGVKGMVHNTVASAALGGTTVVLPDFLLLPFSLAIYWSLLRQM